MLIGGAAVLWLLLGLPARHLGGGDDALKYAGAAAIALYGADGRLSLVLTAPGGKASIAANAGDWRPRSSSRDRCRMLRCTGRRA